jgi:hypothetical protein
MEVTACCLNRKLECFKIQNVTQLIIGMHNYCNGMSYGRRFQGDVI